MVLVMGMFTTMEYRIVSTISYRIFVYTAWTIAELYNVAHWWLKRDKKLIKNPYHNSFIASGAAALSSPRFALGRLCYTVHSWPRYENIMSVFSVFLQLLLPLITTLYSLICHLYFAVYKLIYGLPAISFFFYMLSVITIFVFSFLSYTHSLCNAVA